MFQNKRIGKIVVVSVAALLLGIFGLILGQTGIGYTAGTSSNVGKVNYQRLINASPDMENFRETMNSEIQQAQKDFNEKSKAMNVSKSRNITTN